MEYDDELEHRKTVSENFEGQFVFPIIDHYRLAGRNVELTKQEQSPLIRTDGKQVNQPKS